MLSFYFNSLLYRYIYIGLKILHVANIRGSIKNIFVSILIYIFLTAISMHTNTKYSFLVQSISERNSRETYRRTGRTHKG